jgi:hypothetical protein
MKALFFGLLLGVFSSAAGAVTYATWNPLDADPSVVLSEDNLSAYRATSASEWVAVRADIGVGSGQWYWETTYTFSGAADLVAGVAIRSAPLTTQPGNESANLVRSVAGPLTNGDCLMDERIMANVGTVASGTVVRHWLDLDSGTYQVANGDGPWTVVIANTYIGLFQRFDWYPIVGLKRPVGSEVGMTANFGATPFVYDVPIGVHPGVFVGDKILRDGFEGLATAVQ